jgi:septum formation protein
LSTDPADSRKAAAPGLVLASASPHRQLLLRRAGYHFVVSAADLDEEAIGGKRLPPELSEFLAKSKAEAVADRFPNDIILAADTVVALGNLPIGKARDADHAREILSQLSGTRHLVITGVCIIHRSAGLIISERVESTVQMKELEERELENYLATDEWRGKAGAYGIQNGDSFATRMEGCRTNIVGLPMTTTRRLLKAAGIEPAMP